MIQDPIFDDPAGPVSKILVCEQYYVVRRSVSWLDSFPFAVGSEDCSGIAGVTCEPLPSLHCPSALLLCGFLCEAVCEGVHQCSRGQKVTEVSL